MTAPTLPYPRIRLFGVPVDALTLEETVEQAFQIVANGKPAQHVVLNAAKVVAMEHDAELKAVIGSCELVNADGTSIVWATKLLGVPLPQRVTGIDLFQAIIERAAHSGHRVYFLGATDEVVSEVVRRLRHEHPTLQIAGANNGFWDDDANIIEEVRAARADFLFLGIPSPRKEFWLARNIDALGVPFVMGVGGTFDVVAGKTRRAPVLWQRFGCEWLYRLLQEPRRMWKRYLFGNAAFVQLLWRARSAQRRGGIPAIAVDLSHRTPRLAAVQPMPLRPVVKTPWAAEAG